MQAVKHPSHQLRKGRYIGLKYSMPKTHQRHGNKKNTWKSSPKVLHSKSRGKRTYPPNKAGPKHAVQAYLSAHQTQRKSEHRIVQQRSISAEPFKQTNIYLGCVQVKQHSEYLQREKRETM